MTTSTWMPARMAGSCRNGAERDAGKVVHKITHQAWVLSASRFSVRTMPDGTVRCFRLT